MSPHRSPVPDHPVPDDALRDAGAVRHGLVPADTSAEAHAIQAGIYRTMGGARRLAVAFQLTDAARRTAMAGIRARHPDYSDEQVFRAWTRLTLGDDLLRAVWPDRELVDP